MQVNVASLRKFSRSNNFRTFDFDKVSLLYLRNDDYRENTQWLFR
jgi:hypothetical protein